MNAEEIDAEAFEKLVIDELDLLPDDMVDGLENVVFVTEDRPEDGSLDLLGLYDGVALTERGTYGFGELPDRIILYREPLLAVSENLDELRDQTIALDTGSGPVLFRVNRPANPCAWMDVALAPGAPRALLRRGGMRCTPLTDGELRLGPAMLTTATPIAAPALF